MDEITLNIAQIEKVRDRVLRYLGKSLDGLEELEVDAMLHTVSEYFNDLTGDTAPIDLETLKPCDDREDVFHDYTGPDKTPSKPHIVVEVFQGCVSEVRCDTHEITHEVIDHDSPPLCDPDYSGPEDESP